MSKLYELTKQLDELHTMVLDGEATEDHLSDTMEMIEGEFQEKALNVAKFMRSLSPSIEAIDNEIKRLQDRKKAITNKSDWVKNYLLSNMEASDIKKIECDLFTITRVKPRDIVVVDDLDKLPDDYVSVKTSLAADKKALLKALKDGEEIEGAHIGQGEASIKIS